MYKGKEAILKRIPVMKSRKPWQYEFFRGNTLSLFTSTILITFCVNFILWSDFILDATYPLSESPPGGVTPESQETTSESISKYFH